MEKNQYNPKPVFTLIAYKLEIAIKLENWDKVKEVLKELEKLIKN